MKATPWLVVALILGGCQVRSAPVLDEGPAGTGGAGGVGGFNLAGSAGSGDGGPAGTGGVGGAGRPDGSAVPLCPMPRPETCNGIDDNCDGIVDDGFDLQTDPANCGRCGNACSFAHATPSCQMGRCAVSGCLPGYADADKKPENGCECQRTNGGMEVCDGADNDCNGQIDEGFDFATDVTHCGGCYKTCEFANASGACTAGACQMNACKAGFLDINKDPKDGCEYKCTPSNNGVELCDGLDNDCNGKIDDNTVGSGVVCGGMPGGTGECRQGATACVNGVIACVGAGTPGPEVCNGKDDDCDGMTDEDDPFVGKACFPLGASGCDPTTGACTGPCRQGTWACTGGSRICEGVVVARPEVCDDVDNDCDGLVDEIFDKQSDPRTCGSCSTKCEYKNAVAVCEAGTCRRGNCNYGYVDANGDPADGCELQCTFEGPEVCDGKDNDCDGKVDAADDSLVYPTTNFCAQAGECGKGPGNGPARYAGAATYPVCQVPPGGTTPEWSCNYPATVQTMGGGQVVSNESWCDGLDNDCDGMIDEHTTNRVGAACEDSSGTGACKRKGTFKCQADRLLDAVCDLAGQGPKDPAHEVCDGLDNDCDGQVDESWDNPADIASLLKCGNEACRGVRDEIAQVGSSYIYRYEASRVDASATGQGSSVVRPCSRPNAIPWTLVNHAQAAEACRKVGMRLCTGAEWTAGCKGTQSCASNYFPYACGFDPAKCNGAERGTGVAWPTGGAEAAACTTTGTPALFDMSGNVAEWTSDQRGMLGTKRIFILRGGSFNNYEPALRCDSTLLGFAEDYSFLDAGFRCCSSCAPGLAECAPGACTNLASDGANCGACGHACGSGKTCKNGRCE